MPDYRLVLGAQHLGMYLRRTGKKEAAKRSTLYGGQLHERSPTQLLLRCDLVKTIPTLGDQPGGRRAHPESVVEAGR
ncbi:uncharacterized protein METZ01_LOCUS26097 [marine metagenome]|uniref:Uncharacterized protein n=1 Tax=marine metagenome TaxID=408172 RepID=A0A381Q6K3_9ZZZZ